MQKIFSNPLQTIMSKVEALPIMKLKYFNCQKGDLHDGEALNYVCIQKGCKENGLICSVCKSDHAGHNVIPLKYFLSKLKQQKQDSAIQSQSFQAQLEQLQHLKNSFLYDLKQTVQKMAQKIQEVEEFIIEKFKKQKIELLSQIELKMRFNEIIESAIGNNLSNQGSFEKDFKLIAASVDVKNDNNASEPKTSSLYFHAGLDKIVGDYEASYKVYNKNLADITLLFVNTLQSLTITQEIINQKTVENSVQAIKPVKNQDFTFNITEKGSNIKISENKKTAQCTNAGNERFALVDGPVQKKGSSIRFKIQKLKNWVGVGLAVRDIIKSKKFHFQYSNLGHGSYLMSNNKFMWSHTSAAHNIQKSDFEFVAGQTIKIEVTQYELIYTNESDKNEKRIPISLTEHEWGQACFCVNLCSLGDAATIL